MLSLVQGLIALRKQHLADPASAYRAIEADPQSWVFSSGPLQVTANFSERPVPYDAAGRTPILSSRTVVGTATSELAPWEAMVSVG